MKRVLAVLPAAAQLAGAGAATAGVYLLVGLAWALVMAGVVLVIGGALREGGLI